MFLAYWQNDLLLQARLRDKMVHTLKKKNTQMHVTGKREGQEVCSEGAPELKAKIGYEHEKIRTRKLENLGDSAHSNKGKKKKEYCF